MPKWWRPVLLGSAGATCVVVPGEDATAVGHGEAKGEEGTRRVRRTRGGRGGRGGAGCASAWELVGTTLSVAEATRVGPALGIYSVSRINPIFIDEDYNTLDPRQRPHYPNTFQNAAPESPGKSGSSGYESNPCSDESPARRGDSKHLRTSAPRRAAASRAARRQACSVHRQSGNGSRGVVESAPGRCLEGDSDDGYARLPLAPIPEGRVGAPLRTLGTGDGGKGVPESAGDSSASCSPASTASSSPASSSSSSSGKRLLKRADAAILLWGQPRGGAVASHSTDGGGHRLLRDALKGQQPPSPLSSAASTVSSGATLSPHRGTVLPSAEGGAEDEGGETHQELSDPGGAFSGGDPPEDPPDGDRGAKSSPTSPGLGRSSLFKHHFETPPWGFLLPPQFFRRGVEVEDGGVPNALKNAMLYGTLCRIKSGVDAYEKLKALERDGCSASREEEDAAGCGGGVGRPPWGGWDFGGAPVVQKEGGGASGKLQTPHSPSPSIASSQGKRFTGHGHADFTLDMPRAERLMRQIAAAKRRRCWGRFLAATFALAFFLISVVAVSMLCTRGKRVFGPL